VVKRAGFDALLWTMAVIACVTFLIVTWLPGASSVRRDVNSRSKPQEQVAA
jgi:hypothetical protein